MHRTPVLMLTLCTALVLTGLPLRPAAANERPVTLQVGAPRAGAIVYGPADMLCDLDKCHLFSVPGFPKRNTIDFQMPSLDGQSRIDLRRCLNLCRASVLGYVSPDQTHKTPHQRNPSITINPIELRLQ